MIIRQLTMNEFEASTSLGEYAFQYALTPEEREERKSRFKPEQTWGIFDGPDLQAKLTILPLRAYLHGKAFDMGGIAGVATWPENRRQGHVSRLLKHALNEMKNAGQTISFLHPFSIPFYRKFGWELYAEYKKYVIPVHKFPPKTETPGRIVRDAADLPALDSVYRSFASRYNGTLLRNDEWWKQSVLDDDGHSVIYYSADGEPQGYALYELKDKELACDEFVFLNEEARSALWTFFANHDSRIEQVSLKMVPVDDELPFLLPDPRVSQETVPYFMARIVDLKSLLEQYPFMRDAEVGITLKVQDAAAPWNDGVWRLSVNNEGRGEAELLELKEGTEADLTLDIQALSAILTGYKRGQTLLKADRIQGETQKAAELDSVVPVRQTLLMDFF